MIHSARAPTRGSSVTPVDFRVLLPTIKRQLRYAFRKTPAPLQADLVHEALCIAFVFYRRLIDRKRPAKIFATPLARFAVLHVRDGRRVGGSRNRFDVSSADVAQRRGYCIEPLDRFDRRNGRWTPLAIPSAETPIPDQVAFRLDFSAWLSFHSRRDRRLIQALASGDTPSQVARKFHLSRSRISNLRLQFFHSWCAFQGLAADAVTSAA